MPSSLGPAPSSGRRPIRAITLRHPWAVCVAHLGKDVENRLWHPRKEGGHAGMYLALHGGSPDVDRYREDFDDDLRVIVRQILSRDGRALDPEVRRGLSPRQFAYLRDRLNRQPGQAWILPGIVAVARLAAVVRDHPSRWAAAGQWNWVLADVVTLPRPVPARGGKGLWELDDRTLRRVRAGYREGRERWRAVA